MPTQFCVHHKLFDSTRTHEEFAKILNDNCVVSETKTIYVDICIFLSLSLYIYIAWGSYEMIYMDVIWVQVFIIL